MEKVGAYTDRATESGEWRAGNPATGQPATPMLSAYFNMLQRELVGVVEAAGLELDAEDDGQLLLALNELISRKVPDQVISTISSSTVLTVEHMGLLLTDASGAEVTATLPPSNLALGVRDVIVRRIDNSGNRLKIQASGTDKIKFHTHLASEGYPFTVLMGAGDWWHLRSDGAGGWWPIGRHDTTPLGRPVFETTTVFAPGGYGALSGSELIRVEWPWLWDHAQQSGMLTTEAARIGREGGWTSGDGVLTFRGPEGRGEFLRVLDDGRGVDSGRVVGSWQSFALQAHDHVQQGTNTVPSGTGNGALNIAAIDGVDGGRTRKTGGTETRPRNIAYPGRIKLI